MEVQSQKKRNKKPKERAASEGIYDIYCITNIVNGKKYVGQSVNGYEYRFYRHKTLAERAKRQGKQMFPIYSAIVLYGSESFTTELLQQCYSKQDADNAEKEQINTLKTLAPNGYNLALGGGGPSGVVMPPEIRFESAKQRTRVRQDKQFIPTSERTESNTQRKIITIDGVTYQSIREAARLLNVSRIKINYLLGNKSYYRRGSEVIIDGIEYDSVTSAIAATGLSRYRVCKKLNGGVTGAASKPLMVDGVYYSSKSKAKMELTLGEGGLKALEDMGRLVWI